MRADRRRIAQVRLVRLRIAMSQVHACFDVEFFQRSIAKILHEFIPICRQLDFLDRNTGTASEDLDLVSGGVSADDEFHHA